MQGMNKPTLHRHLRSLCALCSLGAAIVLTLLATLTPAAHAAGDTSPAAEQARFEAVAGRAGDAARGRSWFATAPSGREWSCASCHNAPPTGSGRHASTGRAITPLAPAFNPVRFTDRAKVDKWFGRNCRDVFQRECSPAEKADAMAYLNSLKP